MNIKLKNPALTAAVAAALCGAAGTASALPISSYAGATKVYYGGATATDNLLEFFFRAQGAGVCAPGTIDVYRAANQRVILCTVSASVTGVSGAVAFHKESSGGSSNGVLPLIAVAKNQAQTLNWLDLGALDAAEQTACGSAAVAAVTTGANLNVTVLHSYTNHPSCAATGNLTNPAVTLPNGGISDTEPALSSPAPAAADVNTYLDVTSGVQIVFGVPVTTSLYRALQQAQGIIASADATEPGITACNTNNDAPTCVPSLTLSQITSLYTQRIFDWGNFSDKNGVSLTASPLISTSFLPEQPYVYMCRRVASSGTQSSAEAVLLRQRCVDGVPSMAIPDGDGSSINDTTTWFKPTPTSIANGSLINAAPSSGNVRSCMDIFDHNGREDGSTIDGRLWAIGVHSTEITPGNLTTAHDSVRFVAIDGVAPTLANVINGDYHFWVDNTILKIKGTNPGAIPVGDARRTILDYIEDNLALPAVVSNINAAFANQPWGNGGVLSPPGLGVPAAAPVTPATAAATPIGKGSHSTTGQTNNCAPAVLIEGSDTPVDRIGSYN